MEGEERRRGQAITPNSRDRMCMSAAYYTLTLRYSPGTRILKGEHPKLSGGRGCVVSKISLQSVQSLMYENAFGLGWEVEFGLGGLSGVSAGL